MKTLIMLCLILPYQAMSYEKLNFKCNRDNLTGVVELASAVTIYSGSDQSVSFRIGQERNWNMPNVVMNKCHKLVDEVLNIVKTEMFWIHDTQYLHFGFDVTKDGEAILSTLTDKGSMIQGLLWFRPVAEVEPSLIGETRIDYNDGYWP